MTQHDRVEHVEHADHVETSINTAAAETVVNAEHVETVRSLELHAAMPLTKGNARLRFIRDIAVAIMVTSTVVALVFSIWGNRTNSRDFVNETRENQALIGQLRMELQAAAKALEENRSDDAEVIECYRRFADAIQLADGAIASAEADLVTAIATYPPDSPEREKFSKAALAKLNEKRVLYDAAVQAREDWNEGLPCPIS